MTVHRYYMQLSCAFYPDKNEVGYVLWDPETLDDLVTIGMEQCYNPRKAEKIVISYLEKLLEIKILRSSRQEILINLDEETIKDTKHENVQLSTITYDLLMTNRKDN